MTNALIESKNLAKKYQGRVVFEKIDITLHAGESIAFTGHNGAGKSTLLRVLAKLTTPTLGSVSHAAGLSIQYIPEHFPGTNMSAYEYIQHMARIEGLSAQEATQRGKHLFTAFFMDSMQHTLMKHLSKGTLQKVAVIQALLTRPDVLMLDEPLSGQDAESQQVFIDMMRTLRGEGTAILMSCHERQLINQIAGCVYAFRGKQLELVQLTGQVAVDYDVMVFIPPPSAPEISAAFYRIEIIEKEESRVKLRVPRYQSHELLLHLISAGYLLQEMYHEKQ